ncbi:MAG: bifunctional 5,10-methylenetetrahydrofolate dehydrogenase/5,10-methenyltetrahydrofolate cyclohydrolase [bacterium]|nr:bifunctional 5,10-methylenetetrahydrofolate dehydrogenase/5,10-methenyltetrahydrofolate cyclohydrolase [bacterium]
MVVIVDGRALRDQILQELKREIETKKLEPRLAVVQVGNDPASSRYIEQKRKAAEEIGAGLVHYKLDQSLSFPEIKKLIARLNRDKTTNGIIVQLPLPSQLKAQEVTNLISPSKDVDGLVEDSPFEPATPGAVLTILNHYQVQVKGKKVVVLGQSNLVGKPLSDRLEKMGAKVTRLDIDTPPPLEPLVEQGDVVVSAVGKIGLVSPKMVKEGAVVIDVGTNLDTKTGKLVGDVDFEAVKDKVSLITPVPGGVGPMTVAMLMKNLVEAAGNQETLK